MKKLIVFLGSCLLLSGVNAQTTHPAKKETTRPSTTKPDTVLRPSNPNDKTKPVNVVKTASVRRRPYKLKNE